MKRTVALVQARMSSTRFPGKVLEHIDGMPAILYLVTRARRAKRLDEVVVVTSKDPSDDLLVSTLATAGVPVHRGDLNDVLSRYATAAAAFPAEQYVRLTGDCPLVDAQVIDTVVALLDTPGLGYASNIAPPTFPDGLDVEAFTADVLRAAAVEAHLPHEREHVTPWMRRDDVGVRRGNVVSIANFEHLRLTVDYPDDLAAVRAVAEGLKGHPYDLFDILRWLSHHPEVLTINRHARNEGYVEVTDTSATHTDPEAPLA